LSHFGSGNKPSEKNWFRAIRSDPFFQRIYQEATTGIAITDWLGVFQECNPAYCELLGYTEKELRSVDLASLVHSDDREANLAQLRRLQAGEISSFDIENRDIHKDGAPMWVHKFVSVLLDENGEPKHLIALVTKTAGRARAEQAQRESQERYRRLAEQVSDGIFVTDSQGRYLDANRAGCEMFGYTLEELKTLTVRDVIAPEEVQKLPEQFLQLGSGQVVRSDWRFKRKDASVFTGELVARQFSDGRLQGIVRDITERKRTEEALRVVSAELSQTLHTAGIGLNHCSRDLRFLSANPAFAQCIGVPLEQIVGRPMVEVMGQAAFEIIRPHIDRVLSGERVEYEVELTIAGERKWIHAVHTPDQNASGHVVGWVASIIDITVRKHMEEELKAANAFLDAIVENVPLMLFIKESQSLRFVRLNRAAEDLLGWPNQTLIGKNAYDYWPNEQADFFVEKDRETLKSGNILDIPEEPIQTRYRGVRMLHTKKVPILDSTGKPIYLLGISDDITERKRIEKEQRFLADVNLALSSSLEYEQTLVTLARLVVLNIADWCAIDVMDEHGQLSRLKVASADPDQAALCAVLEQMPPDRDLPDIMRSVIESKRPIVVEQVTLQYIESLARGPGHLQALVATGLRSFVAVPLMMREQALGALFLGSSTLSHVFGQNDLRLAEALAERAAIAIENAHLFRQAQIAIKTREEVLAIVSHDLKNPLANITLSVEAFRRSDRIDANQVLEFANKIQRSARAMETLIADLLDFARIQSGTFSVVVTPQKLNHVVMPAINQLRGLAEAKRQTLDFDLPATLPYIAADTDRLGRVVANLLTNAIKFTPQEGTIRVSARRQDRNVLVSVADTGPGIPPEHLQNIFDRYWQVPGTMYKGTGLGLSIARGIVEAHGGTIWAESQLAKGSCFFFTLPMADRDTTSTDNRSIDIRNSLNDVRPG
jgi:PAS domain S-box-containing protein